MDWLCKCDDSSLFVIDDDVQSKWAQLHVVAVMVLSCWDVACYCTGDIMQASVRPVAHQARAREYVECCSSSFKMSICHTSASEASSGPISYSVVIPYTSTLALRRRNSYVLIEAMLLLQITLGLFPYPYAKLFPYNLNGLFYFYFSLIFFISFLISFFRFRFDLC